MTEDIAYITLDEARRARAALSERSEPPRPLMRELPTPDPFPLDALGELLGPAAEAIVDQVQVAPAIAGQSVLAVGTLAVQGHADIELPTQHTKPLSNFFLSVAATGDRKTAADTLAGRPLRERETTLRRQYNMELPDFENAKYAWEKAREASLKRKVDAADIKAALDAIGPRPVLPLLPMLTCPDPTYEGLCRHFVSGLPSIGIFSAEGGQFLGGYGMSEDAKLRTAAGLSDLWDGSPLKRVRASDGTTIMPGRRLTGHIMAQPDVAAIALNDPLLANQGLLSRLLVTAPASPAGTRLWHEPSVGSMLTLKRYDSEILTILEAELPLVTGTSNELMPRTLKLNPEAREEWIGFADHIEKAIGAGGELEPVRGLANKLPEHAARLAGVLALVNDLDAREVRSAEMEAGIMLAQHYANEALRLFGGSRVDLNLLLAQRLLDWLQTRWPENAISLPDIYQRSLNAVGDAAMAKKLVKILEEHGWLVRLPGKTLVGGQRRRDVWQIMRD